MNNALSKTNSQRIQEAREAGREMPPVNLADLPAMALAGLFMLLSVLCAFGLIGLIVVRLLRFAGVLL